MMQCRGQVLFGLKVSLNHNKVSTAKLTTQKKQPKNTHENKERLTCVMHLKPKFGAGFTRKGPDN